jgi:Arc/MetJ-type ribon-helix-helix transcriptional regulator
MRDGYTFSAMTVALNLPADLQAFIEQAVKSGRFADEKELLCEAIETLKTREEFRQFQLAGLKEKLRVGAGDIDAGRVAEWNAADIKRKGRELLAERLTGA